MPKLIKTYENRIEKSELIFMGETYDYSMLPTRTGRKGDKPCFDYQVSERHPELKNDDALMEWLDQLCFATSEDEILDILNALSYWERKLAQEANNA